MKRKQKDIDRKKKRRKVSEEVKKYTDAGVYGMTPVNPGEKRTWGQYGTDMVATASGAALGYITMNVPGAMIGGHYGNRASQFKRHKEELHLFDQEKTKVTPIMSTSYGGKLRRSKGKSTNKIRNMYQAYGAVAISESYGRVTDPDVVGVGHITWNQESIQRVIGYAILRKLFLQSGIIVQTPIEEVRMVSVGDSSGFKVIWVLQDADGSLTNGSYVIPGDATLESIYAGSGLNLVIQGAITQQNPSMLERIMLMSDAGGDRVQGQLIMRQQRLHITCNAHTVIQNRTKSATGSAESTQVDAQPLKGPVFEFSGMPRTKEISPISLNTSYSSGSILFRKGQLGGSDPGAWSEPPVRSSFNNVTKSSYCRLAPGVLKDMEASKTWEGPINNLLQRWRVTAEGLILSKAPGITQMAFLEEELNSGSANLISVSYETQFTVGCKLTTMKAPNMQPYYNAAEQNNFGA